MKIYAYIRLADNTYPLFEGDIRLEYPEIKESQTGDTFPCPPTYAPVFYVEPPVALFSEKQRLIELPPINTEEGWKMQFEMRTYTDEEYAQELALREAMLPKPPKPNLDQTGSAPDVI